MVAAVCDVCDVFDCCEPTKIESINSGMLHDHTMSVVLTASQYNDYLAIRVQPPSLPSSAPLLPKHAVFLFDTSGSMSEEGRMEALKNTMKLLIQKKPVSYKFTFVSYNSKATIDALAEDDATKLHAALEPLRPDGGTNIEAALVLIRDVVAHGVPIDAMVLFTDGHVNDGAIRKSSGFISLLQGFLPVLPPIHTIGCGPNYNQQFLKNVADETRSIHFYADVGETLPAVVADILEGMRTEVATQAMLAIPDGWINAEYGKETLRTVTLGHLIADHTQWIVLKPVIESGTPPTLTLHYLPSHATSSVSVSTTVSDDLNPLLIAEQVCRVRIAAVYNQIQDLLEKTEIAEVLTKLDGLATELKASVANKTTFVLTALAQIEEMKESLILPKETFHGHAGIPSMRLPGGPPPLLHSVRTPSGPPLMSRLVSNTSALTNQRGFFSRMSSGPPDETYTFSSPAQRQAQRDLTQSYAMDTNTVTP